jgi:hypothetical protein
VQSFEIFLQHDMVGDNPRCVDAFRTRRRMTARAREKARVLTAFASVAPVLCLLLPGPRKFRIDLPLQASSDAVAVDQQEERES